MPRNPLAYLSDIIEACDAVSSALQGVDVPRYESSRLIRSAVERELILIGEAVGSLTRLNPAMATQISHARMIVGFRNLLTHDYAAIKDATVWAIASHDVPILRRECAALVEAARDAD